MPPETLASVDTVMFDFDGTLVDSMDCYYSVFLDTFSEFGLPVVERAELMRLMRNGRNILETLIPADWPEREYTVDQCRNVFQWMWDERSLTEIVLHAEVAPTLHELRERGLKLGLATAARGDWIEHVLDKHGIASFFQAVVTMADVEARKPAPDLLLECLRQLDSEPDRSVYVGDSPIDILAAKSAGVRPIGVLCGASTRTALQAAGPDLILDHVGELLAVLDQARDMMISGSNGPSAAGREDGQVATDLTRGFGEPGGSSGVLSSTSSAAEGAPELGSYVNNSTFFKGVIESSRSIGIDGKFEGEIHSQADVVIGRDAEVRGNIQGETVIVAGKINGNVNSSTLELQPSAQLLGNIRTGSLLVGLGAIFRGQCDMGPEEAIAEAAAAPQVAAAPAEPTPPAEQPPLAAAEPAAEQPSHGRGSRRRSNEPEEAAASAEAGEQV